MISAALEKSRCGQAFGHQNIEHLTPTIAIIHLLHLCQSLLKHRDRLRSLLSTKEATLRKGRTHTSVILTPFAGGGLRNGIGFGGQGSLPAIGRVLVLLDL